MVNFTSNGKTIQTELFSPKGGVANGGVIVIAYGTFGMEGPWGEAIREYADSLAQKGFTTLIPDYFGSTGTAPGFLEPKPIFMHRDTWQQIFAGAITFAKALSGVNPSRIGLLGFSLGGHICLRNRSFAKVLVEFFAPQLDGLGTTSRSITHAQIHHGLADEIVQFNPNADSIKDLLTKERAVTELFEYPNANHGFIGDDSYNLAARKDSMERTLACFEKNL
jgi:dienelactone hydrolase